MGGDGGVVAKHRKFMRGFKHPEDRKDGKDIKKLQRTRSRYCAQSGLPLADPIVACEMGHLYNKEAMCTALLERTLNRAYQHVRGLKDLRQLIFTPNAAAAAAAAASSSSSSSASSSSSSSSSSSAAGLVSTLDEVPAQYMCPVTCVAFNGLQPFVVIWTSGHVLSEKAVREMGVEALQAEYGPFTMEDVVHLLPLDEDVAAQSAQMEARREKAKREKDKGKKKEKRKREGEEQLEAAVGEAGGGGYGGGGGGGGGGEEKAMEAEERKARKAAKKEQKAAAAAAAAASSSSSSVNLSSASTLALEAGAAIKQQAAESSVFSNLFHTDKEGEKGNRDLFIGVSGIRYTLN